MIRHVVFACMTASLVASCAHHSQNERHQPESESFSSKILSVYSVEDNGAQYRAYLVTWKGKEVIAEDPLGQTEYQVGNNVTVIAIRVKVEDNVMGNIQPLTFVLKDFKRRK